MKIKILIIAFLLFITPFFSPVAEAKIVTGCIGAVCQNIEVPDDAVEKTNPYGDVYWQWTDRYGNTSSQCANGTCYNCEPPEEFIIPPQIPPYFPPEVPIDPIATPKVPACNSPCQEGIDIASCQGAKDGCTVCQNNKCVKPNPINTPTPTPTVPACNMSCANPAACNGAQNGCTFCNPSTDKCETPPACNTSCEGNPNVCQQASGGCTLCNPSTNKCEKAPTPTSIPTATPTTKPTATPTATPKPTATATPTPSPTPLPFDDSMCSCDGLTYQGQPTLGAPITVTGYGKVLGANKNYAKIPTMKFALYKTISGSQVEVLDSTTVNTTIAEETDAKVRYQASWTVNLPSTLEKGVTYRIKETPVCSRKSAAIFNSTPNRVVLAESDEKPQGIFSRFFTFILSIFGGNNSTPQGAQSTDPVSTPTLTDQEKKNLQLKTFTPAKEAFLEVDPADNCTFIRFKF